MLSLEDLTTPVSTDDVKASIYRVLAAVGVDTTTWKPGAVARTLIAASAIVLAAFSTMIALIAGGGFLETATGQWLTLVARYVFGVERLEATFAAGTLTLTNTGGGVYSLAASELIVTNPDTGKSYRNTSAVTLNAVATLTIPIAAIESGSASTSTAGTIVHIEAPAMTGVACSNAAALVGLDEEGDAALQTRCSESLGPLSPNGPWDAYTYVARNAQRQDGTPIGITRVRVTNDGYGNVFVFAATATGAVTGDPDDATTDLGAISEAIQQSAVPLAVTAEVDTANPLAIAIGYTVWLYNTSGRSKEQVETAIATALATYLATRPIGGDVISGLGAVFVSALEAVIGTAFSEIFKVTVTTPVADQALSTDQVPVLGSVTPVVNFVTPPVGF